VEAFLAVASVWLIAPAEIDCKKRKEKRKKERKRKWKVF